MTREESKAGADVEVSGGTKFYLSAPLTQTADVSGSWSATMKGSITKDYSAYKITTGSSTQDLALVFGEGVADEKYVDFSVKWLELAKVGVVKVDSKHQDAKLSGAVFGIYSDKNCTQLITQMPATDNSGASVVEIVKTQDTVYLKEITAPKGYRINTTAYNVKLVANQTATTTVPDEEQLGELTVYKEGQVLTGADVTDAGVTFRYENRRQEGAVYDVYAGEDIYTAYGAQVYEKGDLVNGNLTTDSNGAVILKNLHLGTYLVRETQAPKNFYNSGEEKKITLSYAGQNVEVVFSETTFTNDRQKAKVTVQKLDQDTRNPLDGGIFGMYAGSDITAWDGTVIVKKGTLIEKTVTGEDGTAAFTADLPIGFGYEVKEEQAPEGYLRNTTDVYSFRFDYTNDKEPVVAFSHTFTNKRVNAKISLQKKDKETNTNTPQGDATLEKAVYGLYARNDIVHPDGATGVVYKAGEKVATLTTDENGTAFVENLYLGNYYVKEITPPVGYLADESEYDLACSYEGDLVATVERSCTSPEQVKKQPFQLIKAANNGKTDADLLEGAGFTAYLVSSLDTKEDGSYDFASAVPVVIGENGATEIFTDEKGYACSIPLPYGTYLVRETTTPHNYTPVDDFIVRITEHKPNTPQVWRVLLDDEFEAKLKIVKQDDETKKPVLAKNTEFKVYDLDNGKYVEQVTTYPTTVVHKSYFTDEQGYLVLPQNLKIGHYRIEEVHEVQEFTFTYEDAEKETVSYEFTFEDEPTVFEFTKTSLTDGKEVEGAKLQVTDENGKIVDEWVSGKEPHIIKELVAGKKYTMTETLPAAGYVTAESIVFTVEDSAEVQKVEMKDDVTKVEISKTDISGKELPGAKLTIFDKDGKVVESWTSTDKPHYIEMLPIGEYTLREESAPEGYLIAEDVKFEVKDTGEIQKVVMKDEAKPSETPSTPTTDTPKTGDESHMMLWLILAGLALCSFAGSAVLLRKKKK